MAYTLQQYNPLSHLGQLLYQDSVAERDARLQQQTEQSRIAAETQAYRERARTDARMPLERMIVLREMLSPTGAPQETATNADGLQTQEELPGPGVTQGIIPGGDGGQNSFRDHIQGIANASNQTIETVLLAYGGDPMALQRVNLGLETNVQEQRTEAGLQRKQVQEAETSIVDRGKQAGRTLAEVDRAFQLLDTTQTGPLSIQGIANLPTDSTAFKLFQAQLRSPEGEKLKRLLANRFQDIRHSSFGDRIFATEIPAALDLVPDLLDRPEVIKAALDTISLGARYDIIAASLYQTLQQMYRAGDLRDAAGRPRRITMMDIQEVYQEAADLLMADADAAGSIESINAALGT